MIETLIEKINQKGNCFGFECNDKQHKQLQEELVERYEHVACLLEDDTLYEDMQIYEYISFFAKLAKHTDLIETALNELHLQEIKQMKIKKQDASIRKRISLARLMVQDWRILYLREPLKNMNEDSIHIILHWMEKMVLLNKQLFVSSVSMRDTCLLPGVNYTMQKNGTWKALETLSDDEVQVKQPMKLSARLHDKILLFHPEDIDYVESMQGKNYLIVKGEGYVSTCTMDELELKLKQYGFYRSHRSYLVNMQKVEEIIKWTRNSYTLKLKDMQDTRIPLSKGRIEEMKIMYSF